MLEDQSSAPSIFWVIAAMFLTVRWPSMENPLASFQEEIAPFLTTTFIKEMVFVKWGFPEDAQVIRFGDRVLEDTVTIEESGLRDNDVLQVQLAWPRVAVTTEKVKMQKCKKKKVKKERMTSI